MQSFHILSDVRSIGKLTIPNTGTLERYQPHTTISIGASLFITKGRFIVSKFA